VPKYNAMWCKWQRTSAKTFVKKANEWFEDLNASDSDDNQTLKSFVVADEASDDDSGE